MLVADNVKTIDQSIDVYLEYCGAKRMSPHTLVTKRRSLERFVERCKQIGITDPREVDLEVMEDFRLHLHLYKKVLDGEPLSINSQYKFLTDLKLFMRHLYRRKIIRHTDHEDFELPRSQKSLPRSVLTHDEIERVLMMPMIRQDERGIRDRTIMEVLYASAIRRSELVRLKLDHIDLSKQTLMVVEGKGLKDRVLPIAERACKWVEHYQKEARPKLLSLDSTDQLFLAMDGKPCNADQIGLAVGRYFRRSGIDKPGACHQFRHSVATAMLENGADIRFIQVFLGHADISSTQIYTHVAIKKLQEVYENCHPAIR